MIMLIKIAISSMLILCTGFGLTVSDADAQEDSSPVYTVIGIGTIQGNNKEIARNQAISGSLVSAVHRAISEILSQEAIAENFQPINQRFLENTGKYIQNYKVLADLSTEMDHRAMVQVTVMIDRIRDDLQAAGLFAVKGSLPKILCLIAEKKLSDYLPGYWWGDEPSYVLGISETVIDSALKEKGFEVIDHKGLSLDPASRKEFSSTSQPPESGAVSSGDQQPLTVYINNPYLSNQEALAIGRQLGAQVVIAGSAEVEVVPETIGETIQSFKGSAALRLLMVDSGREILATNQSAVAMNADETMGETDALQSAGKLAAAEILAKLTALGQGYDTRKSMLTLNVQGTGKLGHFVSFRQSLMQLSGVESLRIKDITPDQTSLEVEYKGTSRELANDLMTLSFDAFGLNIFDIQEQELSVKLVSKETPGQFE